MGDLAVLVEEDTPESMLDKLSTALQVVKEVCEENFLTLHMSAGKTEAHCAHPGQEGQGR